MRPHRSMVLLEQIRVVDKRRLREFVDRVDEEAMEEIDEAIGASLSLSDRNRTKNKSEEKRLCLCPACANQFYTSPDHVIRRLDGGRKENDVCEYCEVQPGFDFLVINRRKQLEDT